MTPRDKLLPIRAIAAGTVRADGTPRRTVCAGHRSRSGAQELGAAAGTVQPLPAGSPGVAHPRVGRITDAADLTFFVIGDPGGVQAPTRRTRSATRCRRRRSTPAFVYCVGDVVYFHGEADQYVPQFYEPYAHLEVPIVAIPGNHDGDVARTTGQADRAPAARHLHGQLLCPAPELPPGDPRLEYGRHTQTQPWCDWTLALRAMTIIGLYDNVPEGGHLETAQSDWLAQQLQQAPNDRPVMSPCTTPCCPSTLSRPVSTAGRHARPRLRRRRPVPRARHQRPCPRLPALHLDARRPHDHDDRAGQLGLPQPPPAGRRRDARNGSRQRGHIRLRRGLRIRLPRLTISGAKVCGDYTGVKPGTMPEDPTPRHAGPRHVHGAERRGLVPAGALRPRDGEVDLRQHRPGEVLEDAHLLAAPEARTRIEDAQRADGEAARDDERDPQVGDGPDLLDGAVTGETGVIARVDEDKRCAAVNGVPAEGVRQRDLALRGERLGQAGVALDEMAALVEQRDEGNRHSENPLGQGGETIEGGVGLAADEAGRLEGGLASRVAERGRPMVATAHARALDDGCEVVLGVVIAAAHGEGGQPHDRRVTDDLLGSARAGEACLALEHVPQIVREAHRRRVHGHRRHRIREHAGLNPAMSARSARGSAIANAVVIEPARGHTPRPRRGRGRPPAGRPSTRDSAARTRGDQSPRPGRRGRDRTRGGSRATGSETVLAMASWARWIPTPMAIVSAASRAHGAAWGARVSRRRIVATVVQNTGVWVTHR